MERTNGRKPEKKLVSAFHILYLNSKIRQFFYSDFIEVISMLWSDSETRRQSLIDLSKVCYDKGYMQTSQKIVELSKILDLQKVPQDFEKQWIAVVTQFEKEFAQGNKFRKQCLDEIVRIIITAIKNIGKDFPKKLLEIYKLFRNMRIGRDTVGDIGKIVDNLKDPKFMEERFYLLCFAYLIMVEGIFDECVRILYFLMVISRGTGLNFQKVKEMKVKDVEKEFKKNGFSPIFLRRWKEKNSLRNSIAHARFEYDSNNKLMHFLDVNPWTDKVNYDRFLNFNQFAKIGLEIEDTVEAFLLFFLTLKIRDFILSPTPYK